MNQDGSFAGAGASHDEHWSVDVIDGFALAIVGKEWSGMRLSFGYSHLGVRISLRASVRG